MKFSLTTRMLPGFNADGTARGSGVRAGYGTKSLERCPARGKTYASTCTLTYAENHKINDFGNRAAEYR